jgi:probable addiction module antidote protein
VLRARYAAESGRSGSRNKNGQRHIHSLRTADCLKSEKGTVAYLDVCAEEGETSLVAAALGDIARARNMSRLAGDAGQTREGL